jgi:hypothetical protein
MRVKSSIVLYIALWFIEAATSVSAHHSFAAEYDRSKPVTLTGSVTKLEWINPHARFHMDVKDNSGNVVSWEVEFDQSGRLVAARVDAQFSESRRIRYRRRVQREGWIQPCECDNGHT